MSKMSNAYLNSIMPISLSNFEEIPEENGLKDYVSNTMNVFGGLSGWLGSALRGGGVMANFAELQRIEQNARQLEDMGLYEQAQEYRKSPGKYAFSFGNEIDNSGQYFSNIAENIDKKYGSREEYKNLGLQDRLTNLDYLTDSRGLLADMMNGLGSSLPSLGLSFLAPEVKIGSEALGLAGKYLPGVLGKGLSTASKNTVGTTLDNVLGYGLNPFAAPLDAFTNAGESVGEHKMQGRTDAEIAPLLAAQTLEELPIDMLNQGIFGSVMRGNLFAPAKRRVGRMAQQAASIPVEMASEYFQEGSQQRLSNKWLGKQYGDWYAPTEDEAAASAAGAIGSLLTAGAGSARGAYKNWNLPQAEGFSGDFEKWESAPGATDLDGVRPEIKGALNNIASELGNGGKITITGGAEKGYHAKGEFGHEGGWKVDIDKNSITDPQKFFALCEKYGIAVGDEGDHYDLSAHKNGNTGGKRVATPSTFLSDMLGGGQSAPTGEREGHTNAWAIYDVFKEAGYSDNAIAGILGRVQQEHNFNTEAAEEKDVEGIGRVGGYGMFQWQLDPEYGGRGNAFLKWAKDNNLDPQNATVQAQYALLEARQRGLTPEKMNNLSAEDAATLWTDEWEVGKHGDERKYAKEWAERISKGGSATPSNNTSRNNIDTSFMDEETAQDNSALINQLNAIMSEDDIGLSREQRLALLNMATEQKQIPLANATAEEEEAYYRAIDDAIRNNDLRTIAQMFPQQAAEILGITGEPTILEMREAIKAYLSNEMDNNRLSVTEWGDIQKVLNDGDKGQIKGLYNKYGLSTPRVKQVKPQTTQTQQTGGVLAGLTANQQGQQGQGQPTNNNGITSEQYKVRSFFNNNPNQNPNNLDAFSVNPTQATQIVKLLDNGDFNEARKLFEQFATPVNNQTQTGGILSGLQAQPAQNVIETPENDIIEDISTETQGNGLLSGAFNLGKALNSYNEQDANQRLAALGLGETSGNPADIIIPETPSIILPEQEQGQTAPRAQNPFNVNANTSPVFRNALQEGNLDVAIDEAERMQDYNTADTLRARKAILEGIPARTNGRIETPAQAQEILNSGGLLSAEQLSAALKVANANMAIEEAKRKEQNKPAPTVKKYHIDGTKGQVQGTPETTSQQAETQPSQDVQPKTKQNEEENNVTRLIKKLNKEVNTFTREIKKSKNKGALRDKCLDKLAGIYKDATTKTEIKLETKAAMEEAYNNAVIEVNRAYDEATAKNVEDTAQAKFAQNNNVTSEAANKEAQTKKAATEGVQENEVEASNSSNETAIEDVDAVKKSLVELAKEVWEGSSVHNRVSFKPSKKLKDKAKEFFGHDIDEVFITSDDVRHIKKHHSQYEEKRGQVSLTPKDFANIYDAVNDFESATLEEADKQGNKKMLVVLNRDGKQYALLIERGKNKAEIKTAYKKLTRMSDVTSPEPNVRNDSKSTIVDSTIPQTEPTSKDNFKAFSSKANDILNAYKNGEKKEQDAYRELGKLHATTYKKLSTDIEKKALNDIMDDVMEKYWRIRNHNPNIIDVVGDENKAYKQAKQRLDLLGSEIKQGNLKATEAKQIAEIYIKEYEAYSLFAPNKKHSQELKKIAKQLEKTNNKGDIVIHSLVDDTTLKQDTAQQEQVKKLYNRDPETATVVYVERQMNLMESRDKHKQGIQTDEENLDDYKRKGQKVFTKNLGNVNIKAGIDRREFKNIKVVLSSDNEKFVFNIPINEIDNIVDKEDGLPILEDLKNIVHKYLEKAVQKKLSVDIDEIHWTALRVEKAYNDFRKFVPLPEQKEKHRADYDEIQSIIDKNDKKMADLKNQQSPKERSQNEDAFSMLSGNNAKVVTDEGEELPVKYRIVEAKDVIASNTADNDTFPVNPRYPKEMQPRDRSNRVTMKNQIVGMSGNLRPDDLMESRNLNQGAPIVKAGNIVVNGNGRTLAIIRAYRTNKAANYKNTLIKNAEKYGFNPKDIKGFEAPILVRELDKSVNNEKIMEASKSTTGGARLAAGEQAKIDADKITETSLSFYQENENGDIASRGNRDFVESVLSNIVGKNDMNAYYTEDGQINADGITRVKRALYALAYGDSDLISAMSESTDNAARNLTTALTNVSPKIAKIVRGMNKGVYNKYPLQKTITDAVKRIEALRAEGKPVEFYLQEQSMFAGVEDKAEVKEIVSVIDKNKRSAKAQTRYFGEIADAIIEAGNPKQEALFGEVKPPTMGDILELAKKRMAEERGGIDLFQDTRGIYDTANNIVTLTENADESTFIHEMGHHYYNVLKQAAKIAGENSQAKKDVDTIDNWANYKKGMAAEYEDTASEKEFADLEKEIIKAEEKGDTKKADELKARWAQERWARGVEEYFNEGVAPTAKLRKIFDNFKKWLKEIYRGLRGAGAKPSEDVRAVMERMIASDKEILSGKASRLTGDTKAAYEKALTDLKAAGVKNAEANAYIAAKMAERLSSAYKEAGEDRSAVSLLPEIRAQEKSAQNEKDAVRKKYEGTKEWLKAPNGEDTNLTEEQWLTVRTPSFKNWFGDWENDPKNASKVVDENGEPLVVYHGARKAGFTVFNDIEGKKASDAPIGTSFFSSSPKIAMTYSGTSDFVSEYGEEIYEESNGGNYACFLNIREPYIDDFEGANWQGYIHNKYELRDENDEQINTRYGKAYFDSEEEAEERAQELGLEDYNIDYAQWIGRDTNNVVQEVIDGEYGDFDGVIIENVEDAGNRTFIDNELATDYIVFNSNQIKSATDNNGEFNENDPSILHQFAGEKSKTANINKLNEAKEMEKRGESKEDIYKATGWIKGKDEKWRYEIPDNLDKIDFTPLKKAGLNKSISLSDIYDNEELYKAYPELKNVSVVVRNNLPGAEAQVNFKIRGTLEKVLSKIGIGKKKPEFYNGKYEPIIEFDKSYLDDKTSRGTLIHEIQHIIQHIERFARGGTGELAKSLMGKDAENISDYDAWAKLGGEQEAEEVRTRAESRNKLKAFKEEEQKAEKTLERIIAKQPKEIQELVAELNEIEEQNDRAMEIMDELPEEVTGAIYDYWYAESGTYFIEETLSTPTIHTDDAIIIFDGKEFSASLKKPAKSPIEKFRDNFDNGIKSWWTDKGVGISKQKEIFEDVTNEIREVEDKLSNAESDADIDAIREKLDTVLNEVDEFNKNRSEYYKDLHAVRAHIAREVFENYGQVHEARVRVSGQSSQSNDTRRNNADKSTTGNGLYSQRSRGESQQTKKNIGTAFIVNGERDDAEKHYQKIVAEHKGTNKQQNISPTEKHSNQGAFSIAEKGGKFTAKLNAGSITSKETVVKISTLANRFDGKYEGKDGFTFNDAGKRDEFVRVANAFLTSADADEKTKASIDAWHGNGLYELIDKFSLKYLGTGEGAQAHGWGLYFAKSRKTGEGYRRKLSEQDKIQYAGNEYIKKDAGWECVNGELKGEYFYKGEPYAKILDILDENVDRNTNEIRLGGAELDINRLWEEATIIKGKKAKEVASIYNQAKNVVFRGNVAFIKGSGHLYHVQIPDKKYMLDENKSFSQQSKTVQNAIKKMLQALPKNKLAEMAMLRSVPNYKNLSKEELIQEYIDYVDAEDFGGCLYYDLSVNPRDAIVENPKAASELLNKYGIKGITYDGRTDGRCYVVFDDNAVEIIEKFSAERLSENAIAKLAAKADIVKMEDLTVEEKRFMEMGEKLGTPVVWVDADPRLNGWHKDGVTFINRNRRMSGEKTFWHEALHFIVQNEDGLLEELADTVGITDEQIKAWKDKTGRYELNPEEVVEEMLCDAFHDPASRVKVFQEIAGKNPSLMEKIMAWINRLKEEFFDVFRGTQGKLTQSQKNNMTRVIDNHFKNLKGKDGKPLFKRKGKEWTLANGESLDRRIAASSKGGTVFTEKNSSSELINPQEIQTVNEITDKEKYQMLVKEFEENGYHGRPIVVIDNANEGYLSLTGSHRIYAAEEAGIDIPAVILENTEDTARLYDASSDEEKREIAEELYEDGKISEEAFRLIELEDEMNFDDFALNDRNSDIRYSLAPIGQSTDTKASPNSNETVWQKIKNIFTSDKGKHEQYRRQMKETLENALGVKIRYGKMDESKGAVIYKEKDKVIRSKHAYDWENILPVAGGVVAEKLGIVKKADDVTEAQRNVFANWMLEGKLDDSPEAKAFEAAMKNPLNAAVKTRLENARTNFQTWQDKEADERMQECIQDQKEKGKSLKEWREHIYNEVVEEFAPIQRLVDAYEEQTGKKLGVSINPMVALRLLRGQGERVLAMVNGETELAVKALQARYPSVDWTNFKTIKDIIGSIGAYQNKEKQNDFATYCVACHMLDLHDFNDNLEAQKQTLQDDIAALQTQIDSIKDATADEKNTLKKKLKDANDNLAKLNEQEVFTVSEEYIEEEKQALTDEIHNLKAQIDSIQVKKDKKKDLKQQLKDAEDNLKKLEAQKPYTIHDDFSREKCEKYIEKRKKEYGKAQRDLVNYSNVLMQILYDSGYISGEHYGRMVNKWKNYVPMYRVFEENEEIDFGDSLMKFEGSKRDIVNPIESIIHNTGEYIKKAERNKAISVLANFARCDGSGWLAEEVDNRDPNTRTQVTFRENGKVKYIELGDPTIAKAINKMDLDSSNLILKLCHAVTAIARASFTTANPEFLIRNPLRDSADAFLYDGVYPWDIVKGFMHAFRKDATYYDWMTSGAAQSSLVSLDRDYTQEIKESMGENWKSRLLSKKFLPTVIQGLQKMSEFSEYATRIAVYKKRKAEYEQAGMDARDAVLSAALRSRDLIDFGRHGKTGANYNKFVPFANASIQGLDKFYRELIDPKGWKEDFNGRKRTLMRLGLTAILPAILVSLLWGDDDWYKKRCPNWVKDTHWVLPLGKDSVIRIPKGADVGIRFFSNAFQKMMDDNPHKFKEYFAPIVEAMPGIGIAVLKPAFEVMVNKNTFTSADIVPKYQEDALPPKMQYSAYTTGFSKWLGEKLDVAPRKIDHLIAGYAGTPGMFIPKAVDVLMGNKQLSTSKEDLPISRALLYPKYKNSQIVQDFYDELKEQTQFENEYKATKKRPEGFDPQKLKRMKDTRKKLTELNKKENTAIEDPKLSYDRRKEIIASIYDQRNKLVERALRK